MKQMEPIQESLKKWMNDNKDFKQRHQQMKKAILNDAEIVRFLQANPEITDQHIERRLNKLYEYSSSSKQCEKCESLPACQNVLQGYSPNLQFINGDIHIAYEKCQTNIKESKQQQSESLIGSLYMPKEILEARMENVFVDPKRVHAIKLIDQFLNDAKVKLPQKGLYLTGPFGVGKTYLLGAIANELKEVDFSSMLIYMPEFVREMRDAIQTNTVTEKINAFKYADVLMIDDIGAETFSAWFRDEVLGSILQYRMMEQMPVFFTSNYTMYQLEKVLATSTKGDVEEIKAGRIMERIKQVSSEVKLDGENRRG